jgi:hypothetical protein
MLWRAALAGGAAVAGAALAGSAVRYTTGVARADRAWPCGCRRSRPPG